jgi:hypothetical protein
MTAPAGGPENRHAGAAELRATLNPDERPTRKKHYLYQTKIDMAKRSSARRRKPRPSTARLTC